jgi:hypothetical protein
MKSRNLYTLIPLEDFKAILAVDDRDEKLCAFCLTISTYAIEQYCHRRLTVKGHFEDLAYYGDRMIPLSHYPIQKVFAVYYRIPGQKDMSIVEPDFYNVVPDPGEEIDVPASLVLYPGLRVMQGERSLRVVYKTGYTLGKVPTDLGSACLELAAWNMNRYKGKHIGMGGNVRGHGKAGEHLEMSMPANVRNLLEPYKRKLI